MRFRNDQSRLRFDVVTVIELGDLDRGYRAIDIRGGCWVKRRSRNAQIVS
jgi:hypothetical protein